MKILYIDDEPDLIAVVTRALRLDKDIDVRAMARAVDGLAMLADDSWKPDVVLLDVMMPDLDGPTTLERIAALPGEPVPVIFFTARAHDRELVQLAGKGAIGILTKPFDPISLPSDVRRILRSAAAPIGPDCGPTVGE